jgi:hypothetical protein
MPLIKGAENHTDRLAYLEVYKAELALARGETTVAAVKRIIENSSLSDAKKCALIKALERTTAGKVLKCAGYAAAGALGGGATGAVGSLVVIAVAAGSASGATVGPAGVIIGAAGGLAVGLALALKDL